MKYLIIQMTKLSGTEFMKKIQIKMILTIYEIPIIT